MILVVCGFRSKNASGANMAISIPFIKFLAMPLSPVCFSLPLLRGFVQSPCGKSKVIMTLTFYPPPHLTYNVSISGKIKEF